MLRDRLVRGERGDGEQKAGDGDDSGGGEEEEEKERKKGLEIMNGGRRNRSSECADRQASDGAAHAIKEDGSS